MSPTTYRPRALDRRERLAVLVRLARAIPTIATSRVLARTTGLLYAISGLLVLGASLDPASWVGAKLNPIRGLCVLAVLIGVPLAWRGDRLPRRAYHVFVGLGTAMITIFVLLGSGAASTALAIPYVFVVVDAAFFFGGLGLLVHLALVALASAFAMSAVGLPVGQIVMVQGYFGIVSIVVAWLARVADVAEHDALTGLVNRRGFDRRVEQELARLRRERGHLAVVLLDVDHFKTVNDTEGHLAGDQLLVRCSAAWCERLEDDVVLSRYGGDKFAVLLTGCSLGRAADLADRMRELAPEGISLSAGVAAWTVGDTPSVLLSRADVALYDAKSAGRDQTVVYGDPSRGASELEAAIAAGELMLHFQPVIRLADNALVSTEALVRWNHPRRGLVPPMEFIPQAERTGAIHALGAWTLEQACATLAAYGVDRGIAVNVSVPELRNPEYVDIVDTMLRRHRVRPDRLALEITEALFDEDDPQVVQTIQSLRRLGVRIAIDDFGTGYSSLRWLERFPVDIVKIDRSFISAVDPARERQPMLEAIIAICRSLGMSVVAEGVETAEQASVLRDLGCDLAQGYLFGRPVPLEELPLERVRRGPRAV